MGKLEKFLALSLATSLPFFIGLDSAKADSINKAEYNIEYCNKNVVDDFFRGIFNLEEYVKQNTISQNEMYEELKKARIILLSDAHYEKSQKEKHIEIVDKIKNVNLVVGLELFHIEQQKELDSYMNDKLSINEVLSNLGFKNDYKKLQDYGYLSWLEFLKENKIKTVALDSLAYVNDFYKRDNLATKIINKHLKKGKQVVIEMGALHLTSEHLPRMIKEVTGIDPVIILQNTSNEETEILQGERRKYIIRIFSPLEGEKDYSTEIKERKITYEELREAGLTDKNVLKVKNDFYINSNVQSERLIRYSNDFDLK